MSIQTRITAHVARQERLNHDTSFYASIHPEQRANCIIACMAANFSVLSPDARRSLLNTAKLEITDCDFRRFMKLALQS